MKTTAILILLATAFYATAQSNTMPSASSPAPRWSVVESPREWPHETDGSNSVIRCVAFAEAEIAKTKSFLLTRSYRILEGGPKRDVPHVVVPYPDATGDIWTIFFAKDTLEPYSIERKGSAGNRYRIQLDPRSGRLTNLSSTKFNVFCDPPGILRGLGVPIRDKLVYTIGWDGKGHLDTEQVYDWAKRGKPIEKGANPH
jgi:hypothetical protein